MKKSSLLEQLQTIIREESALFAALAKVDSTPWAKLPEDANISYSEFKEWWDSAEKSWIWHRSSRTMLQKVIGACLLCILCVLSQFSCFRVLCIQMEQDFKNADKDADGKLTQDEVSLYLSKASLPDVAKQNLVSLYDLRIPNVVESKTATPIPSAKPIQELVDVIIKNAIKAGKIGDMKVEPAWYCVQSSFLFPSFSWLCCLSGMRSSSRHCQSRMNSCLLSC
jgi:hypothetical protein